jgi:hypothetical protein
MQTDEIPTELRRFLQANLLTVPHIELILLLRRSPAIAWRSTEVARRLYVSEERAKQLLAQIEELGVIELVADPTPAHYYRPATPELGSLLDLLDVVYAKHLLAVTQLVHAARDGSAEHFAKAFKFRKEP